MVTNGHRRSKILILGHRKADAVKLQAPNTSSIVGFRSPFLFMYARVGSPGKRDVLREDAVLETADQVRNFSRLGLGHIDGPLTVKR